MSPKMPAELILRILRVFSKTIEKSSHYGGSADIDSLLAGGSVDIDSLLALLKCHYVSRSFAHAAQLAIRRTVSIKTTEAAQSFSEPLRNSCGLGYPLDALILTLKTSAWRPNGLVPGHLEEIVSASVEMELIFRGCAHWIYLNGCHASQPKVCLPINSFTDSENVINDSTHSIPLLGLYSLTVQGSGETLLSVALIPKSILACMFNQPNTHFQSLTISHSTALS